MPSVKQFRYLKDLVKGIAKTAVGIAPAGHEVKTVADSQKWFHGTTKAFKRFKIIPKPIDPELGIAVAAHEFGHYFAQTPKYAEKYIRGKGMMPGINFSPKGGRFRQGANVRPVALAAGRVLDVDHMAMKDIRELNRFALRKSATGIRKAAKLEPDFGGMLRAGLKYSRKMVAKAGEATIHPEFGKKVGHPDFVKQFSHGNPLMMLHQLGKDAPAFLKKQGYDSVFTRREGMRANQSVMTVIRNRQIKPRFGK